jgi:hypothetical protein
MGSRTPLDEDTGLDRRRIDRAVARYLRTYSPAPATIIDLSCGGMCLEAVTRLTPGLSFRFRVRHRGLIVHLTGEIRWSAVSAVMATSGGATLEFHRAGARFATDLPESLIAFLHDPLDGSFRPELGDYLSG